MKNQPLPFDSKFLMEDGWREKLASAFEKMPELKRNIQSAEPLSGVYVADFLLLPEWIRILGDLLCIGVN